MAKITSSCNDAEAGSTPYRIFCAGALLSFLTTVIYFFHNRLGNGELYDFVLPAVTLVALIFLCEGSDLSYGHGSENSKTAGAAFPFVGGVLAPIAQFPGTLCAVRSVASILFGRYGKRGRPCEDWE